jgi:predicted  nucleic acid-binding Zn-ribbon protein
LCQDATHANALSGTLRLKSEKAQSQADQRTKQQHEYVNDHFRKKIGETQNLLKQLDTRIANLSKQFDGLTSAKQSAEQLLTDCQAPLRLCEKREKIRSRMPKQEIIHDNVQRSLARAQDELRHACSSLHVMITESDRQLTKINAHRQLLSADRADKTQSLAVDQKCLNMQNTAVDLSTGVEPMSSPSAKSPKLPKVWQMSTGQLLTESQVLESQALKLRTVITKAVVGFQESVDNSMAALQNALRTKLQQSTTLYSELNKKLESVLQELDFLEKERQQLADNIQAKSAPLRVARERIAYRKLRPERETARDAVEDALEEELATINGHMGELQSKLQHVDQEIQKLSFVKYELETDLTAKGQALQADRQCLELVAPAVPPPATPVGSPRSYLKTPRPEDQASRSRQRSKGSSIVPKPPGSSIGSCVSVTSLAPSERSQATSTCSRRRHHRRHHAA